MQHSIYSELKKKIQYDTSHNTDNFINKFVKETQVYIETDKLTEVLEIIEHFCTGHFNN